MFLIFSLDLICLSFLVDTENGEEKVRTHIVEAIQYHSKKLKDSSEDIKFRCYMNNYQYEKTCPIMKFYNTLKRVQIVYGNSNVFPSMESLCGIHTPNTRDINTVYKLSRRMGRQI